MRGVDALLDLRPVNSSWRPLPHHWHWQIVSLHYGPENEALQSALERSKPSVNCLPACLAACDSDTSTWHLLREEMSAYLTDLIRIHEMHMAHVYAPSANCLIVFPTLVSITIDLHFSLGKQIPKVELLSKFYALTYFSRNLGIRSLIRSVLYKLFICQSIYSFL